MTRAPEGDVDLLRRAAALMREQAQAATPGPWFADEIYRTITTVPNRSDARWNEVVIEESSDSHISEQDLYHITSWHPGVALAVADLLESIAEDHDRRLANVNAYLMMAGETPNDSCVIRDEPIALALAYLGEQK